MAVKTLHYHDRLFTLSYDIINPSGEKDIVFLHGWGSSKTLMKQAFGSTLNSYRHIYIDLPGFGGSTCDISLITNDYAEIIEQLLRMLDVKKEIILGHSFGGKVATLLQPKLLVLVASAGILVPKPLLVRIKIALFKLLKFTGFTSLRSLFVSADAKGMSEAMYQTFKNVVNEDFSDVFRHYFGKALLCFGTRDTATPLWAGEKMSAMMADSRLVAFDGDHYFLFKEGASIAREIETTLAEEGIN